MARREVTKGQVETARGTMKFNLKTRLGVEVCWTAEVKAGEAGKTRAARWTLRDRLNQRALRT